MTNFKKIVFMGTGYFAKGILEAVFDKYCDESKITVFTKENKPSGRGMKIKPDAVEIFAEEKNLEIFKPHTLKEEVFSEEFSKISPDIVIVASYGLILPKYIIEYPRYGCINVHGSLLPKLRGAAPINRAIIDGEEKTGITIMKMDEGLDTGDMIISEETFIGENECVGELYERLTKIGASLITNAVSLIDSGKAVYTKQDDSASSYASKITNETRTIDWNKTSKEIHNLIRGLSPYPGAVTKKKSDSTSIKIFSSLISDKKIDGVCGTVFYEKPHLYVKTKDGAIEIISAQPEGKNKMSPQDLYNGRKLSSGEELI